MQSSFQEKRQLVGRVRSPAYRRIPRQQSLDFIDYPRRGVSVRESPALLISRKLTRSPIARLSIPDHGGCLILNRGGLQVQ